MAIRIIILGCTGSIGTQALDVARKESDRVEVVGLSAHTNIDALTAAAKEFRVADIAITDTSTYQKATKQGDLTNIYGGPEGVLDLIENVEADIVLNALVGAAGLRATIATLKSGARLALANKESLVIGGEIVMPLAARHQILPVDSEHGAIFQCLLGEDRREIDKLWLTASGGPFFGKTREDLATVTRADALAHPTWNMGEKISVDSASLMNKGLEVIEAHYLFGVDYDDIKVVVHRQSCVHSMVQYCDGSVLGHLGVTDMRIPIQYAFSYPARWSAPQPQLDFTQLGNLTFEPVDLETFGCLNLAYTAGRAGGSAPVSLNAANEIAVEAFLSERCSFLDIERTVSHILDTLPITTISNIRDIEEIDAEVRIKAGEYLLKIVR